MYGGDASLGVLYKIGTDGSGYSRIASFSGVKGDGAYPTQSLIINGNTLYGLTVNGGLYQGTDIVHYFCPTLYKGIYYYYGGCGVAYSLGI